LSVQAAYPNGVLQNERRMDRIDEEIEDLFEGILGNLPRGTPKDQSVGKQLWATNGELYFYIFIKHLNIFQGNLMDTAVAKSSVLKSSDPVLVKAMYQSFLTDMRSDYGCNSFYELNAVATSKLWDADFDGNNNVNLKNGYIKLIEYLASRVPASAIRLNERVTNINWAGSLSTVQVRNAITGNTVNYQAKYIVSSLPLGVLKNSYTSLFSPPLPVDKTNAIQRLSFGTVDKIFLVFDKPYFPETSDVRFLWPDGFAFNMQSSANPEFYKNFAGFAVVPNRPNILVTLIAGQTAIFSESLSDQQLLDILTELFRKFYPRLNLPRPKLVR